MNHARLNYLKSGREKAISEGRHVELRGIEMSLKIFYILNEMENTKEAMELLA